MDFLDNAISWIGHDPAAPDCPECGHPWRPDIDEAAAVVATAPARYAAILDSGDPYRIVAPLTWSASAYTWHVTDLCNAWAERAVSLEREPDRPLAGFDPDELAGARNYLGMGAGAAVWALERAARRLCTVVVDEQRSTLAFEHAQWGPGTMLDGFLWVTHELAHHEQDVTRSAQSTGP